VGGKKAVALLPQFLEFQAAGISIYPDISFKIGIIDTKVD